MKTHVALAAVFLLSFGLASMAYAQDPVPLPCDPVDCPPVPITLPGCPTCPDEPAPSPPDYPPPETSE
jgi:hypothetical protein